MRDHGIMIFEGRYRTQNKVRQGIFHLVEFDPAKVRARFVAPPEFYRPDFVNGFSQALPQGRLTQGEAILDRALATAKGAFQEAAKRSINSFLAENPGTLLISDASNAPFNEGHFAIQESEVLPLPEGSQPITGRQMVLTTRNGEVDFFAVKPDSFPSVSAAQEGFFVAPVVQKFIPLDLTMPVKGTDSYMISNFRGHIGQIFDDSHSKQNSPERARIHTELLKYLRDPRLYSAILSDIVQGKKVDIAGIGKMAFKQQVFTHTYWIRSDEGAIFALKTYPFPTGKYPPGVRFAESYNLLSSVAREYGFGLEDAFIGTNGRDVRIITLENGQPVTIEKAADGTPLYEAEDNNHFHTRILPNFIAFLPR